MTVDYATADLTARASDNDYTPASGTLTFAPGETQKTITVTVTVIGDDTAELDEAFAVGLYGAVNATIAKGQGVGTILNDDGPGAPRIVNVEWSPLFDAEGDDGYIPTYFVVSLNEPGYLPVTVRYATVDGTATLADDDYLAASGVLTFAPGEVQKAILVYVKGDTRVEPDETFSLQLSDPVNAVLGDVSAAVATIANDDAGPTISYSTGVRVAERDSGPWTLSVPVALSVPSSETVTVDYATADDSATVAGGDFVAASGTVTFAPGETSKTIEITIVGDLNHEEDERFFIQFSNPSNAALPGWGDMMIVELVNDDVTSVVVSIGDATITEGDAGISVLEVPVTLNGSSREDLSIPVRLGGPEDTAAFGVDYGFVGSLYISAGDTMGTVQIPVVGDTQYEPDETFTVVLLPGEDYAIGRGRAVVTIANDDAPPTVSIGDVTLAEGNGGPTSFDFPVTLSEVSGYDTTVDFATAAGSASSPADYIAASGTLTIPAGSTSAVIAVQVNGDTTPESDETFTVNLTNPVHASIAKGQGIGTIANDDVPVEITTATLPDPQIGVVYGQTIQAAGGLSPYSYAVTSGALPAGLSLAPDGTVSGTPTQAGSFAFTVVATDATQPTPATASRSYTVADPVAGAPRRRVGRGCI